MIRISFLVILILAWTVFICFGKKDRMDYVSTLLPTAMPEEVLEWRSEKLFFDGWSVSEPTHRWSNMRRPTVCLKSRLDSSASGRAIAVTFLMNMVEPLIGRSLKVVINDQTIPFKMILGQPHILNYHTRRDSKDNLICVTFELPLTIKVRRDPRNFGISFGDLFFDYLVVSGLP